MKQIYTKTGDEGQTSLRGGMRVDKDDIRIETNGQIDHLNALLGVVRNDIADELLLDVQRELMVIMSHIATPEGEVNPKPLHSKELTARMEKAIDDLTAEKPMGFVLPCSMVHVARTQCRTVERRLWTLNRQFAVEPDVLCFFNRLSDYLFVLAL